MSRKKILHFHLRPLLSGPQNMMFHILEHLNPAEYDIYVTSQPEGPLVEATRSRGYTHIALKFLRHPISPLDILAFIEFYLICRKYKFDIVHTHSSKPGLIGRIAARLAGVPLVIYTGHGWTFHFGQTPLTYNFYMTLERIAAHFCDRVIFVSDSLRTFYVRRKMIKPDKAVTIRNALPPVFHEQIRIASLERNPVGKEVVIGSLLRFSEAKNIIATIQVAIKVCKARDDVRFIFIGDGELFELCRLMVQANRLEERILLPGWQNNTAAALAEMDAFLLYSVFEGFPLSIVEAMTSSLPVIGSDIPGIAELVDDTCGWLIPFNQPALLERELLLILDNKNTLRTKGKAAYMKVTGLCSYDRFLSGYEAVYAGKEG